MTDKLKLQKIMKQISVFAIHYHKIQYENRSTWVIKEYKDGFDICTQEFENFDVDFFCKLSKKYNLSCRIESCLHEDHHEATIKMELREL